MYESIGSADFNFTAQWASMYVNKEIEVQHSMEARLKISNDAIILLHKCKAEMIQQKDNHNSETLSKCRKYFTELNGIIMDMYDIHKPVKVKEFVEKVKEFFKLITPPPDTTISELTTVKIPSHLDISKYNS